jgi:transcriptional regulator with XRE-family HTH domain
MSMTLGKRLQKLRAIARLSQNQLAKRSHVPQSVIAAVESGRQKSLSLDAASRLADVLGVSRDLLAGLGDA